MRFSVTLTIEVENKPNLLTRFSWSRRKRQIKERDGETCRYCGRYTPDGQVDHIMPLSRGGNDDPDNLAWACPECNNSKGDKTLAEWGDRPLPTPVLPEPEIDTPESVEDDTGNGDRAALIKELAAQDVSKRRIALEVFGYTGGAAFDAVSKVLNDEALAQKVQELYNEGLGLGAIAEAVYGYRNAQKTGEIKEILGLY